MFIFNFIHWGSGSFYTRRLLRNVASANARSQGRDLWPQWISFSLSMSLRKSNPIRKSKKCVGQLKYIHLWKSIDWICNATLMGGSENYSAKHGCQWKVIANWRCVLNCLILQDQWCCELQLGINNDQYDLKKPEESFMPGGNWNYCVWAAHLSGWCQWWSNMEKTTSPGLQTILSWWNECYIYSWDFQRNSEKFCKERTRDHLHIQLHRIHQYGK